MKIVLIWASANPEKYWNKILKDLVSKWHKVFPVNPKETQIEGIKTYKSIWEIKEDYEIINFVVKPEIVLNILENNFELIRNKTIWCQPGASDEKVKGFLEKNNFKDYILDSCIMIENIKKTY